MKKHNRISFIGGWALLLFGSYHGADLINSFLINVDIPHAAEVLGCANARSVCTMFGAEWALFSHVMLILFGIFMGFSFIPLGGDL